MPSKHGSCRTAEQWEMKRYLRDGTSSLSKLKCQSAIRPSRALIGREDPSPWPSCPRAPLDPMSVSSLPPSKAPQCSFPLKKAPGWRGRERERYRFGFACCAQPGFFNMVAEQATFGCVRKTSRERQARLQTQIIFPVFSFSLELPSFLFYVFETLQPSFSHKFRASQGKYHLQNTNIQTLSSCKR